MLDVFHGLFGLRARVAQPNQSAFEIGTHLATDIDGIAGAHRLAQVVVQRLVRIGVFGIEHADTGMGRHQLASINLVV
ncbi:hypothetical protein D3C80_1714610 [compost metagenome]